MDYFSGYQIIESRYCSDRVQAKKHKKKRINKKWRKRYGTKEVAWKKLLITSDGKIIGHPAVIEALKTQLFMEEH